MIKASVTQLGYLGLSVRDVNQWEQFAAQVHTAGSIWGHQGNL
jgi:hypothetical protein